MKKVLWGLLALIVVVKADLIHGVYVVANICVDNYYYTKETDNWGNDTYYLYFHSIKDDQWYKTSSTNLPEPFKGYVYDTNTSKCYPDLKGGLYVNQYNFLMALAGLLGGFVLLLVILKITKRV